MIYHMRGYRIFTFILVLAVCMTAMAQSKLTPQAQLRVMNLQKKAGRAAARASEKGLTVEPPTIRLIVKMRAGSQGRTLRELQQCGARLEGLLGRQVVVSVPATSVERISHMEGVERIDVGRKPHLKTDVSRQETGVSLLNGPAATLQTPYTGEGVTICLIDLGFDYQHPAFKHADGTTRIKCVYRMADDGGNPFVYHLDDPDWGSFDFPMPGSVYDTPELIATLTTDNDAESHGTHTASTAAGSLSPQGFGGMAPEADIVLIPLGDVAVEAAAKAKADDDDDWGDEDDDEEMDDNDIVIMAISFASAYAQTTGQPVVLSVSLNSHCGPHNGTSSVSEAISGVSDYIIPVFSAGNEGENNNYINYTFTEEEPELSAFLTDFEEGWLGTYSGSAEVSGFVYDADDDAELSVSLSIIDPETEAAWQSEPVVFHRYDDVQMEMIESDFDDELAELFDGTLGIAIGEGGADCVTFQVIADGDLAGEYLVALNVQAPDGATMNLWSENGGFEVADEELATATNDCSGGDWTSTDGVISVGAYCANTTMRFFSGATIDMASEEEGDDGFTLGDIASFSSYGGLPGGTVQPTVCAPGVNIVAAVNHYNYAGSDFADAMQWQGFPYHAESGTSMACPTVAGIIALWLQACPTLTFSQVKEVLQHSSVTDEFTAANPIRWGYGKINAKAGLDYILQNITTAIHDTVADGFPVDSTVVYDLQGRRVAQPTRGLYIQNGRKVIR